jgi:hypothetical protein
VLRRSQRKINEAGKMHDEEFKILNSSEIMRGDVNIVRMGDMRNECRAFI